MSHSTSTDKSLLGFLADGADEDARRALETELLLAAHLRALSRVSLATGHDIRTPLHTMVLYLELLRNTLAEPPGPDRQARQERYVNVVGSEIQNLEAMLDHLLSQTRLTEDRIERFDLVETVRDLHDFLEPHRRRTRIEFPWRPAGERVAIEGHRGEIRHALVAILIAAIEATPAGGELALGVAAADGRGVIALSGAAGPLQGVLDGTREDFPKQRAFGPERDLHVARRVVERHGGTLQVRLDASRVATLEIQLPLAAAENG
jgi:signal transduction histidine kinase